MTKQITVCGVEPEVRADELGCCVLPPGHKQYTAHNGTVWHRAVTPLGLSFEFTVGDSSRKPVTLDDVAGIFDAHEVGDPA